MADNAASTEKAEKAEEVSTTAKATSAQPPAAPTVEDDSDPDFDDLDDVLDQFAANAPSKQQAQTNAQPSSQPLTTSLEPLKPVTESSLPTAPQPNETEDEFLTRLTNEMAAMLPSIANDPEQTTNDPEAQAKMAAEVEALTHKMEADGMKPEDLLKMIFGAEEAAKLTEAAEQETKGTVDSTSTKQRPTSSSSTTATNTTAATAGTTTAAGTGTGTGSTTFEDTIRRTMSRLDQSNTEATAATNKSSTKSEEDLLAEMLKAFESGGAGGAGGADGEDNLSKMFLDMMQQLTHKEVLYEPMKELHDQYPAWLSSHQPPKLSQDEFDRYTRQSRIVAEITGKFEDPRFSDDDAGCREFIWEKMQQMQGEGAPPEELVKNPFPGTEFGGMPGLGGGGGGDGGPDEGCPTQ